MRESRFKKRREIWKYGERGFRYTQLDVGHAYASCVLSAAFQGWNVSVISEISDASLKKMLGMTPDIFAHEAEVEHPALLAIVSTSDVQFEISEKFLEKFDGVKFQGKPNQLSYAHVVWPLVKRITEITEKVTYNSFLPPHFFSRKIRWSTKVKPWSTQVKLWSMKVKQNLLPKEFQQLRQ